MTRNEAHDILRNEKPIWSAWRPRSEWATADDEKLYDTARRVLASEGEPVENIAPAGFEFVEAPLLLPAMNFAKGEPAAAAAGEGEEALPLPSLGY